MESPFNPQLRIAIVHDILHEYGGSERVLEALLSLFPHADLYTLYMNPYNPTIYSKFKKYAPKTAGLEILGKLMTARPVFHLMKFIGPLYFYFLNLSSYDIVISSSHAFNSKNVRKRNGALHICYMYTPPRHIYGELSSSPWIKRMSCILFPVTGMFRLLDKIAATHPDVILVPSAVVQRRVRRYYGRSSTVVYPPVHIPPPPKNIHKKNPYYLFVSRLVRQKGVELVVDTCTRYALPLKIVGEGYLSKNIRKRAGKTIQFLGRISDKKLSALYGGARALLFCAQNEDFGIVPVEAMAHGVPVIAYDDGAARETIIDGKTGILFRSYTPEGLFSAIQRMETSSVSPEACYVRASAFGTALFERSVKTIIRQYMPSL